MTDMTDQRPMSHEELLIAVDAAGQSLLDHGLRVDNIGFVLAANPAGLAAFKIVNCNEDNATLRVALATTLREFARQVESGQITLRVQGRN